LKHLLILLIVAIITLTAVFILYLPDLLEDVWLWLIGLAGPIIGFSKRIIKSLASFFNSINQNA